MKKTLALILAAVMALSLVACAKTPANGGTEAKGSVYYLNFKPEADQAWQDLAKTYTEQTGVEVKVVTAASGQYDTMLTSELDKVCCLPPCSRWATRALSTPMAISAILWITPTS